MPARRILVIEDEPSISAIVRSCLQKLGGWTVLIAESGSAGLVQAETEQPDAILLDVMMPDIDGLSLLKTLQNNPSTRSIPVILLTAKVQTGSPQNYTQLGVVGVIAKPFDPLRLAQQVGELLGWFSI